MDKPDLSRLVAIAPKRGVHSDNTRDTFLKRIKVSGIETIHVGAGREVVYVVVPDSQPAQEIETFTERENAEVIASSVLKVENAERDFTFDRRHIEALLDKHPINYDIRFPEGYNKFCGLCGKCGGVGRHIGPPCIDSFNAP